MALIEHHGDVAEHPVWEELRQGFWTEFARALCDDVRPAWEEYFKERRAAPQAPMLEPLRALAESLRLGMVASMAAPLFDDVRPEWERYFAATAARRLTS